MRLVELDLAYCTQYLVRKMRLCDNLRRTWYGSRNPKLNPYCCMSFLYCFDRLPLITRIVWDQIIQLRACCALSGEVLPGDEKSKITIRSCDDSTRFSLETLPVVIGKLAL